MAIEWQKQTFQSLKAVWQSSQNRHDLSDDEFTLKGRYDAILCFVDKENDRIWPPGMSPGRQIFNTALSEVLSRLPEDDYYQVESEIGIILDNPDLDAFAINVPARTAPRDFKAPPDSDNLQKLGIDTIVFFSRSFAYSTQSMIALIAHEFAHSFVSDDDDLENEALANAKVREWGFGRELDRFEIEKKSFIRKPIQ